MIERMFGSEVRGLHPDLVEIERLGNEICELAAHIEAAKAQLLSLVGAFDALEGGLADGCRSTAHWLNWRWGTSMGEARAQVEVATALVQRPLVAEAFAAGALSFAKTRAIVTAPSADLDAELVPFARTATTAQVERTVREWRKAADRDTPAPERPEPEVFLRYRHNAEGNLTGTFELAPEAGALLLKGLEAGRAELRALVKDGVREGGAGWAEANAHALTLMAESYLAHGVGERGGDDRYRLVVHVAAGAEGGVLEDGLAMSMEAVRRVACDASVVTILEDPDGCPLEVSRETRTISTRMRRALQARDRGCRFPGCGAKAFTEGHHVQWVSKGGKTKLSNLVLLCWWHHHLVHEGGWSIERTAKRGRFVFRRPDGELLEASRPPPRGDPEALLDQHRHLDIDSQTIVPDWDGTPCDYGHAVDALVSMTANL